MKTTTATLTLPDMKRFTDFPTMLRAYMGPMSQEVFARMVGINTNSVARACLGRPMPQEDADKIAAFFRMNTETKAEFFGHLDRARAMNHKAVAAYLARIEEQTERAERLLVRIAKLVPPSGAVPDDALKKLREISRAIIDRHEPTAQR